MNLITKLGNRWSGINRGLQVRPRRLRNLRSDAGTSVLELALLTPVMLVLLLGIIDVGRYAQLSILVTDAARAGGQYGAQSLVTAADSTGIENAAVEDAPNVLTTSKVCVATWVCYSSSPTTQPPTSCPTTPPSPTCPASALQNVYVQVTTQAAFAPLFHYPGLPTYLPVTGVFQMRVAQ
jgi:Flp pilus assembly protein TadG